MLELLNQRWGGERRKGEWREGSEREGSQETERALALKTADKINGH